MESDIIPLLGEHATVYIKALGRRRRVLKASCRLQTTQYTPNTAQTCVKVEH